MTDTSRRKFVTIMGASAVAIPVSAVIGTLPSHAADMLDPASEQALALQYVEVSETADQSCSNCALYSAEEGAEAGACPLFAGSQVASGAWCSTWNPKAS